MKRAWATLKRLHSDQRGAEGLEKLLIIAAIVLPLLGVLLLFRDAVKDFAATAWERITGGAPMADPDIGPP